MNPIKVDLIFLVSFRFQGYHIHLHIIRQAITAASCSASASVDIDSVVGNNTCKVYCSFISVRAASIPIQSGGAASGGESAAGAPVKARRNGGIAPPDHPPHFLTVISLYKELGLIRMKDTDDSGMESDYTSDMTSITSSNYFHTHRGSRRYYPSRCFASVIAVESVAILQLISRASDPLFLIISNPPLLSSSYCILPLAVSSNGY
jgi:hypothetical protein